RPLTQTANQQEHKKQQQGSRCEAHSEHRESQPRATPTSTTRVPKRSIKRPAGRHKTDPNRMAQKLRLLKRSSSIPSAGSSVSGLAIMPSPCVRPGRVGVMAVAATTTFTQP